MTYHDFAWTYHGLISSYITLLTYFCVRGTDPTSTHCTASTMVGRGPIGCHITFSWVERLPGSRHSVTHGGKELLPSKVFGKGIVPP